MRSTRSGSALLSVFSAGALLRAAVGLYGLIAYVVGRCRREIGLRLALGADARRVVALIVGNGMALVAVGLLLGSAGGIAAGRALEHQLFQTASVDAATFVTVAVLLVAVSAVASVLATWRAVQVEPHASLRAD